MKRLLLAFASIVPCACAGADGVTGGVESTSSTTGTEESSSSSSTTASTTTNPTMASDSLSDTTPPESSSSEESSSTTAVDSSSGDPCPVGTLGCACDVGACESDLICIDDVCEAFESCAVDGYEPNESEDAAVDLGTLGDGDDPGSIAATLDHADDADWFTYFGDDNVGLPPGVAPLRDLSASGGLRLCKFLECPSGIPDTEVTCPNGSDLAQSPGGRPGCCSSGSIMMPDFNCNGGTDDSAYVYIRLDNAEAQCVDYTVSYEY